MKLFTAIVDVMLKSGISDPQGQTIERALPALGFESISKVRVGKHIEFEITAPDAAQARLRVEELCERLLANPVIESYELTINE